MPVRNIPIIEDEIYHIYNRGIAKQPIFKCKWDYQRFYDLINFYRYEKQNLRFSFYKRLSPTETEKYNNILHSLNKSVEIIAFCFMPNHFHILAKQKTSKGLSNFLRKLQNSYAKYFNLKYHRTGSVFQSMFKLVRIESEDQLAHVIRYIHLNPLTSYILKDISNLESYLWTSYKYYLDKTQPSFIEKDMIMDIFHSISSLKKFTVDQVEYQRTIHNIKHLIFE